MLAALILGMLFYILLLSRRILLVFSTFFGFLSPHDCRSFPADFDACRKIGQKIEKKNGQESIEKKKIKQVRMVIVKKSKSESREGYMKKKKQTRRRRDAAQRRGKLGISTVIVVLIAVFLLRGHTMDQRNAAYVEELAQLQNKIDAEEARTQDIADLEAYMQTDEYAEQVAKDKLGLVYEDEIIFKPEEN